MPLQNVTGTEMMSTHYKALRYMHNAYLKGGFTKTLHNDIQILDPCVGFAKKKRHTSFTHDSDLELKCIFFA